MNIGWLCPNIKLNGYSKFINKVKYTVKPMFSLFHKHKNSIIKTIITFFVAVLMLSFGIDIFSSGGKHKRDTAIKVNNTEISFNQLHAAEKEFYDLTLKMLEAQYGEMFDKMRPEFEQMIAKDLAERTQEDLIQKNLFHDFIARGGLTVPDNVVKEIIKRTIESIPALGTLNKQTLSIYLRSIGLSEKQLTQQTRDGVLTGTIARLLSDSYIPLETEVENIYHRDNDLYSFSYVEFNSAVYENKLRPSDEDLRNFFESRQENYRSAKSVTYYTAEFAPRDYEDAVEPTDEDIEEGYLRRRSEFRIPPKWTLRQIVIKKNDSQAEARQELVLNIKARLNNGENFAALAKEFSEDLKTRSSGGMLGVFEYKDIPEAIRDRVVELNKGELTEIINTGEAYVIVLAEDVVPEEFLPLETVKSKVAAELRKDLSPAYAGNAAEEFRSDFLVRENRDISFKDFASGRKQKITSKTVRATESENSQLDSIALRLPDVGSMEITELPDGQGFAIVMIEGINEAVIPDFSAVKDRVLSDFRKEKSAELAFERAQGILGKIRDEDDQEGIRLADLVKGENLEIKKINAVKRTGTGSYPLLQNPIIKDTLFNLTKEQPVTAIPIRLGSNFYVFGLDNIVPADASRLDEQRAAITQQERDRNQTELMSTLMSNLKLHSKIWVNPDL